MNSYNRRQFIGTALASTAGATVVINTAGVNTVRAREAFEPLATTSLGGDLFLLTGAGANVVAMKGADGLLLVDGGLEKNSAELEKVALKAAGTKRVHTLFNTHWHPEQTGSNERLGRSGAKIIAHENTKLWLTRKISVDWRPGVYGPFPAKALPTQTFYSKSVNLTFGDEPIEYGYMPQAHTDGDIYVFFRKANVLVAGGVGSTDRWPVLDYQTGGWIAGLVAGLDTLIKVSGDDTRIVPANGPVMTKTDLQEHRKMYFSIYDRVVKCLTKGLSPAEAIATEPAKEFNPQWGSPNAFVEMAFKSLWGHFAPDA
jgi:glyoxylase-like metal-dependent hydrolase (beta-lactamase superfamily II)